jgi:predicted ATPase
LQEVIHDAHHIREHAFRHIAEFFTAVALISPVTVLILEDVQWADERSLDLIDYLYQACQNIPLLIICSGRPSLFENRSSWPALETTEEFAYQHLKLAPLSPIDSRHLISELFRDKPQLPLNLIDLIVERTGGSPFYITELIEMLIEDGVIIRDGSKWRVQMGQMQDQQKLPPLTGLLQARLDQLPQTEKRTLQQAAVFGRIFWKSAVIQLAQAADNAEPVEQIESALQSLEEKNLIYHHNISGLAGVQEYVFGHNRLRSIAHESIPLSEQRVYHAQAAAWLIVHSDPQVDEYAPVIASHFERGGNIAQAAKWYDRAGAHARATHAPETAIQLYRKAINLLSDETENAPQILTLREALGEILRWQSRFATAIEEYGKMLTAARNLRDAKAEARAFLGIVLAQNFQGDYAGALNICDQAEEVISDSGSSGQLAQVWASKAWALVNLDEVDTALNLAREALSISASNSNKREMAYSHALIGYICRKKRWYDQAVSMTEKALALFQTIGDRMWEGLMFGNLGQIAYAQRDYSVAINFYQDSLVIAVDIGDHHGTVRCLRALGNIAQHQDDFEQAASFYQQALVYANKGHNHEYAAFLANDLGQLFLTQATEIVRSIPQTEQLAHLEQANVWFQRALASAQIVNVPLAFSLVKSGMARLLVEKEFVREALPHAQEALNEANRASNLRPGKRAQKATAIAWRTLGTIIGKLPSDERPEFVGNQALDASSCFDQSLQILQQLGSGAKAETAHTLYAWAEFELRYGNHLRGTSLMEQARNAFT